MKRLFFQLLLLVAALPLAAQTYWDGTADKNFPGLGTEASPYLISTPEQLAGLAERTNVDKEDFAGKYIKLTADIYLTNYNDPDTENWKEWHPIAHEWWKNESEGGGTDYGYFRGHFDGDGHTIYNLYYDGGSGWGDDWDPEDPDFDPAEYISQLDLTVFNRGLFCNVDGGSVENLNLSGARMNGMSYTALLVVKATGNSVIRNCHVQGSFRGFANAIGGIASQNEGLIENCSANIDITTAGGGAIVHNNKENGVVRNCTATGAFYTTAMSTGAFANTNDGLIEKSSSSVNVTCLKGKQDNNLVWGHNGVGFIHNNNGIVRECSATGNVTINSGAVNYGSAGFCQTNMGLIESCYSTGTITDTGGYLDEDAVAQFVANNGLSGMVREGYPVIRNCFSTSKIVYTDSENIRNNAGAFVYSYNDKTNHDFASFPFCWFNADGVPSPKGDAQFVNGFACWGKDEAELKSQAFVDTLNLCASFLGTSQWELKDGIPQPTGVYVKNTTVFFDGGDGTKESPYQINTKKQLENFRWLVQHGYDFMNQYVLQTADIELNAPQEEWKHEEPKEWAPIGTPHSFPGFAIASNEVFLGNYDGGFHKIKNLYIDNDRENQGLFGKIGPTEFVFDGQKPVTIQNLGVTDAYMVVTGSSGILASSVGKGCILKQCWTSGKLETSNNWGSLGALFGSGCNDGFILNCSSSARIKGTSNSYYGDKGFVSGNMYYGWMVADNLVNYLFTGNINNGESGNYINNGYYSENVYEDGAVANITHDGRNPDGVRTTEWLQSKAYVNLLNATVERWNAENDEFKQLHFFQWNEGAYPTVSPTAEYNPGFAITFNSNGGSEVAGMTAVSGSTVQPPMRPKKDDYLFAGWYKDEELTTIFKFGQDLVEEDMTLYAKWLEDTRFEYDITPFSNKFADEYHIQTAAQLRGFAYLQNGAYDGASVVAEPRDFSGKTIVLDNDIYLNDISDWQEWGKGAYAVPWRSIGSLTRNDQPVSNIQFKGTFDGQGHVIYGLYVERGGLPSLDFGGLFYRLGDGAAVKNLGIEASVINLKKLCPEGQTNDARWYYYGNGSYTMEYTAMLANWMDGGVSVSQCYASGIVYGPENDDKIGGLTGQWPSTITNCYSRVNVYLDDKPVGYFIGDYAGYPNIANCYNAGITRDGIRGYGLGGDISSFYFNDGLVVGDDYRYDKVKAQARTTAEMKKQSTYEGWDFEPVWALQPDVNDGYPCLRIFHPEIPVTPLAEITVLPTAIKNLIYTGSALTLITAGAAEGGEMQYSLDGENYSSDLPTAIEIGSYTVYYRVKGDAEHRDLAAQTLNVTISNSVDVTMSETETRTFCSDQDLDFSGVSGLKAYIVSGFNPLTGTLTLTPVTQVPAGTGLLLHGEPGNYDVPVSETYMYYTNLLKGVTEATVINPTDGIYTNFILANGSYGIGFYTISVSDELAAGKAYLQIPTAKVPGDSDARCFILDFENGEATGIGSTKAATPKEDGVYYDLTGRRVEKPSKKGIYILNGKKIWVK